MLKKFKSILAVLMTVIIIFSLAGCNNGGKVEYSPEDFDVKSLQDVYVSQKFFDSLNKTKSVKDSMEYGRALWVNEVEDTGEDVIMIGDLHQGGPSYILSDETYDEKKQQHIMTYISNDGVTSYISTVIFTYSPQNGIYHLEGSPYPEVMIDDDMKRIGESEAIGDVIAYELLKDSPDVTIKEDKVYANIGGEKFRVYILGDVQAFSEEEDRMFESGALGFVSLIDDADNNRKFYYYFVEAGNMIIKDSDENIIATLEM